MPRERKVADCVCRLMNKVVKTCDRGAVGCCKGMQEPRPENLTPCAAHKAKRCIVHEAIAGDEERESLGKFRVL